MREPFKKSSFLSCEKDCGEILKKLFIDNPYRNDLIRLLVINTDDCLDDLDNEEYNKIISSMSINKMKKEGYIKITPKVAFEEHPNTKSFIVITFDNFVTTETNPKFRDCTVTIDIICNTDCWDLGNCRLRPFKIAGCIDSVLDQTRLSGIGTFNFLGCKEIVFDSELAGYSLMYTAVHGEDDWIPG